MSESININQDKTDGLGSKANMLHGDLYQKNLIPSNNFQIKK